MRGGFGEDGGFWLKPIGVVCDQLIPFEIYRAGVSVNLEDQNKPKRITRPSTPALRMSVERCYCLVFMMNPFLPDSKRLSVNSILFTMTRCSSADSTPENGLLYGAMACFSLQIDVFGLMSHYRAPPVIVCFGFPSD